MSRVTLTGLNKIYKGQNGRPDAHAVRDLDLVIEDGEMVTLLGPSGCGKTTTLRMLAGFEIPDTGRILIDDRDITTTPVNQRGIGMVFQSYALFPHMSVRENVAFGLQVLSLPAAEARARVDNILSLMDLGQLAERQPAQLSGGQQQRVALARTVVTEPRVLLFDEPLSNLDAQLRERMRDELRLIQQRLGITSLYVTHDQSEAMAISDRVVVMRGGVIEQDDAPAHIYSRPESAFVAEFMGRANILPLTVEAVECDTITTALGGAKLRLPLHGRSAAVGGRIDYVLRPEQIRLDPAGAVTAEVERVVFQGAFTEYQLRLDGRPCTVLDWLHHSRAPHAAGQVVRLSLDTADPWPLPTQRASA